MKIVPQHNRFPWATTTL